MRKFPILLLAVAFVSACASFNARHRTASSAYAFLYPDEAGKIEQPGIAEIKLPARVGIAFVPESDGNFAQYRSTTITEIEKHRLLRRVADAFKDREYIHSIEIIPSSYLRPKGGFANLDQLATMYDIDIIALVAYDQVQTTDQDVAAFTYWTLIGAYVVPGEKNTTTVMLDTVVYDIASRRMLLRAPGVGEVKGRSTPINQGEQLRLDAIEATTQAAQQMIGNLEIELDAFRQKVRERPDDYRIVTGGGSGGGGGTVLLMLAPLLLAARLR